MTLSPSDDVWRTARDIAALFNVQTRTVWAWRRRGHITTRDGLFNLTEVLDWYDNHRDTRRDEIRRGVALPPRPV